jgi:hypothetical protein
VKLAAALLVLPLACLAQQPHEQEIQRALIQLDQRSADFARGSASPPLDPSVGRPLHPDPEIARQLRPYERMKVAEERESDVLRLPPPVVQKDEKPLPLPGGPRHGVEPVAAPRSTD